MDEILIESCGWQRDESVTLTFIYPDGRIQTSTMQSIRDPAIDAYAVSFTIRTRLTDPIGDYTYRLTGRLHTTQRTLTVSSPSRGRMKTTDAGELLYGFKPNEMIRLFLYKVDNEKCLLAGWQELTANSDGQILVQLDLPTGEAYAVIAVGEISGEVRNWPFDHRCSPILRPTANPAEDRSAKSICPNAPDSRLSLGRRARVTYSNGINVRVRSGPGANYDKIASFPEGTKMTVTDGPICADNYVWWKVKIDSGPTGWVAEGGPGNYFIEPLP